MIPSYLALALQDHRNDLLLQLQFAPFSVWNISAPVVCSLALVCCKFLVIVAVNHLGVTLGIPFARFGATYRSRKCWGGLSTLYHVYVGARNCKEMPRL